MLNYPLNRKRLIEKLAGNVDFSKVKFDRNFVEKKITSIIRQTSFNRIIMGFQKPNRKRN